MLTEPQMVKDIFSKIGTTNKFCVEFGSVHLSQNPRPLEGEYIFGKQKSYLLFEKKVEY